MIRRKKLTIFTDAKDSTTVLELKKMIEGETVVSSMFFEFCGEWPISRNPEDTASQPATILQRKNCNGRWQVVTTIWIDFANSKSPMPSIYWPSNTVSSFLVIPLLTCVPATDREWSNENDCFRKHLLVPCDYSFWCILWCRPLTFTIFCTKNCTISWRICDS